MDNSGERSDSNSFHLENYCQNIPRILCFIKGILDIIFKTFEKYVRNFVKIPINSNVLNKNTQNVKYGRLCTKKSLQLSWVPRGPR